MKIREMIEENETLKCDKSFLLIGIRKEESIVDRCWNGLALIAHGS